MKTIKKLEENGMLLTDSVLLLDNAFEQIKSSEGIGAQIALRKFENVLVKNNGF